MTLNKNTKQDMTALGRSAGPPQGAKDYWWWEDTAVTGNVLLETPMDRRAFDRERRESVQSVVIIQFLPSFEDQMYFSFRPGGVGQGMSRCMILE